MPMAQPIPTHIVVKLFPDEAFDMIRTLRSVVRDFENVPESIAETLGGIVQAWQDLHLRDLPQGEGGADESDLAGSA